MITEEQYIEAKETVRKFEEQSFDVAVENRVRRIEEFWFKEIPNITLNVRILVKDDGEAYYSGFGGFPNNKDWYIITEGEYKNRLILRGVCNKV